MGMMINRRRIYNGGIKSTAKLYIQEGLIFMFDGIENAGYGKHTHIPTQIRECVNGAQINPPSSGTPLLLTCEDNALYVSKENGSRWRFDVLGLADAINSGAITNEICCVPSTETITSYGSQEWGMIFSIGTMRIRWLQDCTELCIQRNGRLLCIPSVNARNVTAFNNYNTVGKTYTDILPSLTTAWAKGQTYCNAIVSTGARDFWQGDTYNNSNTLYIGKSNTSGGNHSHPYRLYNLRLYNRALTAEEIAYNHNIDKIRFNLTA